MKPLTARNPSTSTVPAEQANTKLARVVHERHDCFRDRPHSYRAGTPPPPKPRSDHRLALQAVVLVDDSGCLVAGAGAWPVCEELAAYAPLFDQPAHRVRALVSMRIADLSKQAVSVPLEIDGQRVLLCGRGGTAGRSDVLSRAAEGVRRILAS
jgi:hypothetical protein